MREPAAATSLPKSRYGPSMPPERVANRGLQLRNACCVELDQSWPVRLTARSNRCYEVLAMCFGPASWTGDSLLVCMTAAAQQLHGLQLLSVQAVLHPVSMQAVWMSA